MTLEQFTQWLNGAAPKFITAYGHGGQPVAVNRDTIVSVRDIGAGRLIINYGFDDESAPVFASR